MDTGEGIKESSTNKGEDPLTKYLQFCTHIPHLRFEQIAFLYVPTEQVEDAPVKLAQVEYHSASSSVRVLYREHLDPLEDLEDPPHRRRGGGFASLVGERLLAPSQFA